ncbi:MAG TPA: hypothetical protein RMH26_01820, partial [Polyangiaceae bacterium LLY-WYZ-15_(1-7)]|nr:hypothetical protein [Polyangiaceae bacterium LLY-WYZ-15_(1-7)]
VGDCDRNPATGCETDLLTSATHCGACGASCPGAQRCEAGTCVDTELQTIHPAAFAFCATREGGVFQCWGGNYNNLFPTPGVRGEAEVNDRGLAPVWDFEGWGNGSSINTYCMVVGPDGARDIYCWGRCGGGSCAPGGSSTGTALGAPTRILASVDDVVGDWVKIVVGSDVAMALRENGQVYTWGANNGGGGFSVLGRGAMPADPATPAPVVGLSDAIDVDTAFSHACAATSGGVTYCWGSDSFDRSGDGTNGSSSTPEPVVFDDGGMDTPVPDGVQVAVYTDGGCLRQSDGDVWCWGSTNANGTGGVRTAYARQVNLGGLAATDLDCRDYHCCAVAAGGVQCWGNDPTGAGAITTSGVPVDVVDETDTPIFGAIEVVVGDNGSCALVEIAGARDVTCWGRNSERQLGDGTTTARNHAGAPSYVMGL